MTSEEIKIHKCTLKDLDRLRDFAEATFVEAFGVDNNLEDFAIYINQAFSRERIQKELNNPASEFHLAIINEDLVGYLKVNFAEAQTDLHDPQSLEVERIYVEKAFRGQNIGKILLNKALEIAKKSNINYLWLGVWEENQRAIRFYKQNGFQKFGTHPYVVGNDVQTDWLMRLNINYLEIFQ